MPRIIPLRHDHARLETCQLTPQSRADGPEASCLFAHRGGPPLISNVRLQMRLFTGILKYNCVACGAAGECPVHIYPTANGASLWKLTYVCRHCGTRAMLRGRLRASLVLLFLGLLLAVLSIALLAYLFRVWPSYLLEAVIGVGIACGVVMWLVSRYLHREVIRWKPVGSNDEIAQRS